MKIKHIILGISFTLFLMSSMAVAQDEEKDNKPKKVRLKLEYIKLEDGTKVLSSILYWKEGKNINPVVGQEVTFTAESDSSEIELGTVNSNKEGKAILHIENGYKLPLTENGFTAFTAKMKKSDKYKKAKKSIEIKDAELNFSLEIVDSIKEVEVTVTTFDQEGNTVPVSRTDVYVYVKRLYSLFKVKNGTTNENGKFTVEFPTDMPGDSLGFLKVIVKVLESEEYGTIEKSQDIEWGSKVSYNEEALPRALWSGEAPLWMIIAILIILLGAWFNFGLSIYKVSQIRKADDQPA